MLTFVATRNKSVQQGNSNRQFVVVSALAMQHHTKCNLPLSECPQTEVIIYF